MKKPGDRFRVTGAPSLGDMVLDVAETLIAADDPRFQRFWNYWPIPKCREWLMESRKVNVLIGANKSTKTTMGVWKCIAVYTGLVPTAIRNIWPHAAMIPRTRPRHVRIIVQDYTKHWPETIKPLLLDEEKWGMLPKSWSTYDPDEHIFYGPDGSYLSIIAVNPREADEDKIANILRGPLIDHTYTDELQRRAVFTESLTRNATLPDGPATVDLGFCPQEGYDWTYEAFYLEAYDRQDNRREKQPEHLNVMRIGMRDNPSISSKTIDAYIATLKPWEVAYRVDGKYSARAGDPYFDMAKIEEWNRAGMFHEGKQLVISNRICNSELGVFGGKLTTLDLHEGTGEPLVWQVWEEPIDGEYYVATCDTAEGNKESDFQCCDIYRCSEDGRLTNDFPVQVAQLHIQELKPGDFIEEVCCMCEIYGECLLVYEVNNTSGGTVRDRSRNYPNLYRRMNTRIEVENETELLGWYTDQYNKPAGLEQLYSMMAEWPKTFCGIRSVATFKEMLAFQEKIVRDLKTDQAKRVWGPAGKGLHDDTITTAYIMAYILRFQKEMLTPAALSAVIGPVKEPMTAMEMKANALNKVRMPLRRQPSLMELVKQHGGRRHGR